jgi:hypothetical protein
VVGKDDNAIATRLQTNSSINDKTLCATNAEIWVEEDDSAQVICIFFRVVDRGHRVSRPRFDFVCRW